MTNTPLLGLPYIAAAQAQKHVTHNEALRALDAIVQLSVLDRDLTAPPANPIEGDRYIVAAGATGAWSGQDGLIAAYQDGAWMFFTAVEGWLAWVADEDLLLARDGAGWAEVGIYSVNPISLVGVNATADATNRLAVKSDAALFSHDDVTPGTGDMRVNLNKSALANTASVLFQTGWSGRAEFGLTGDDDFHVKVSANGTDWTEAIKVDGGSGGVSMPFFDSQQISVGNDQVGVIQPPSKGGIVFLSVVHAQYPQNPATAIFSYDVGSSPGLMTIFLGSAVENWGTTTLTGTTGTDGNVNVAVDGSGNLHIENRYLSTGTRQFCLTFINSYRDIS